MDNYRAIAVSTAVSKIFECAIADEIVNVSDNDMYQFGFKKGHSTGLCTNILKHTVNYYSCLLYTSPSPRD